LTSRSTVKLHNLKQARADLIQKLSWNFTSVGVWSADSDAADKYPEELKGILQEGDYVDEQVYNRVVSHDVMIIAAAMFMHWSQSPHIVVYIMLWWTTEKYVKLGRPNQNPVAW
jgi:hypothetical protein